MEMKEKIASLSGKAEKYKNNGCSKEEADSFAKEIFETDKAANAKAEEIDDLVESTADELSENEVSDLMDESLKYTNIHDLLFMAYDILSNDGPGTMDRVAQVLSDAGQVAGYLA